MNLSGQGLWLALLLIVGFVFSRICSLLPLSHTPRPFLLLLLLFSILLLVHYLSLPC